MNERIEELYLHAFPPSLNDSTTVQMSAEKFAELIIQECADLANEGFGTANFGLGIKGRNLKEHFGVKE